MIKKPVERLEYLKNACIGKVVCDIGAMDETAYLLKQNNDCWLHGQLAQVAKHVVGIDNSDLIPKGGFQACDGQIIYKFDIFDLKPDSSWDGTTASEVDIFIAGELIEHLANPLDFLKIFIGEEKFSGKKLILSTPNATALYNAIIGSWGLESTHKDHLQIYSYKVLNTLCLKTNAKNWNITPYFTRFTEMKNDSTGIKKLVVCLFEKVVNFFELLSPLKAGGYILEIDL